MKTQYPNKEFVCLGDDQKMTIFTPEAGLKDELIPFISAKTHLHNSAFRVAIVDAIPRNEYGKVKFAELEAMRKG